MKINFELDTSSAADITQLGLLATIFNNGGKHLPVATGISKNAAAKPDAVSAPVKDDAAALGNMPVGERVTIEQVREVAGKKKTPEVKAVFTQMGFEGLSKIPTERLSEALDLIKALSDK